jgi:hypothetical protein
MKMFNEALVEKKNNFFQMPPILKTKHATTKIAKTELV